MFQYFNPSPGGRNVGDCAVRAMCAALGIGWGDAYAALCLTGYAMAGMPNANSVWGRLLRERGFAKKGLPNSCMDGYTVGDFASDHPSGVYVLVLSGHVVCVRDGKIMDTWDSSGEIALYYFEEVH